MKKRLLSLLLLVAMIVTALPLMVLPAVAAEKSYTEDDYNALYVQDGLIFALDFFSTNSYWGESATTTLADYRWSESGGFNGAPTGTVANGALDMATFGAYIYTSGLLSRTALGATGVTSEYVGNFSQVNSHSNFLRPNDTTVKVNYPLTEGGQKFFNVVSVGARWTGSYDFREADGSLVDFKAPIYDYVNTLTFAYKNNGFTQGYYEAYMYPSDVVLPDSPAINIATAQQYFYVTHTYDPDANGGEGGVTKLATPSKVMYATFVPQITPAVSWVWDATAEEYVKTETAKRYIYGSTARNTAAGVNGGDGLGHTGDFFHPDPGHISFYVDGTAHYDSDVYYPDNSRVTGETYFYSQNATLNAFRQYNRILTEAELAQNRLADLLKWFRADLSYVRLLNAASLALLAETAAGLRFEDATAAAMLEAAAKALAETQYSGAISDEVLTLAATYDLDVVPLITYPKSALVNTYTFLTQEAATSDDVAADYAAAVGADIAAYLATNSMTAEDYNALYVDRGLQLFYDFSPLSSLWNTEGETYTLPVGPSENSAYLYNGVTYDFTVKENRYFYQIAKDGVADTTVTYETFTAANDALAQKQAADETATYTLVEVKSEAMAAAYNEWIAAEQTFLDQFRVYRASGVTSHMISYRPLDNDAKYLNATNLAKCVTIYTNGDGYLRMRNDGHSSGGLQVINLNTLPSSDAYSTQLTAALGGKLAGGVPIIFHDIRPQGTTDSGRYTFTKFANTSFTSASGAPTSLFPLPNNATETVSLTYSITGANVAGGTEDVFTVATEDGVNFSLTGTYEKTSGSKPNGTLYVGYSNSVGDMRIYAYRHYTVELTEAERLQNHFADVVKHLRLNIAGYESLDAAGKAALYDAVADLDLSTDRATAQNTISAVLTPAVRSAYEALKLPGATERNAFLDVAADYLLDVSAVLASRRDVSAVYELVTADALFGKSSAEAQALLDEAFYDAYYYLSYAIPGETAFNDFLTALAENAEHLDTEALMALPKADRIAAASLELTAEAIDDYVEEKMADYTPAGDYDYDSLYVQDGLKSQIDFFKLNSYWGETVTLPEAPASQIGTVPVYRTDKEWIVVRWNNTSKIAYYHLDNITTDAVSNGATVPHLFATQADAEAKAAALRTSTGNALWDAIPYPGNAGENVTDAYKELITAYKTAVNAQLAAFTVKGDYNFTLSSHGFSQRDWHDQSGKTQYAPYTYADGYLQMNSGHADNFLLLTPMMPTSGVLTGEYIVTSGEARSSTVNFMHTSDVTVKLGKVDAGSTVFNGFSKYSGTFEETSSGRTFATPYTAAISNITPYSLATVVDRGDGSGALSASLYFNGMQIGATETTTDSSPSTNIATQLGYSSANVQNRFYAVRYYDRALTAAEYAQNHFADLAKFYRLDVAMYDLLSDALRAELYAAVADFTLAEGTDPEAILEAMAPVFHKAYDGIEIYEDADKNALFLELAELACLDLATIRNLDADARAAIADPLLANFHPAYAVNADVVNALYESSTYSFGALTFAGYQVRIDTGAASQNYAGVRAIFDINEEIVATLEAEGRDVTLSIEVTGDETSVITITYDAATASFAGTVTSAGGTTEAIIYDRTLSDGSTVKSVNYTVTYRGAAATAENYAKEFAYTYAITVDAATVDFAVNSTLLGDSVTAFEIYEYFAGIEKYADDRVIASVLAARS